MAEADARAHLERFNTAVTAGDWSELVATLDPGLLIEFDQAPDSQ